MQLGGQLERVECLFEEDGVEYLEGAAAGQRQEREVKARRLAGLGVVNSIETRMSLLNSIFNRVSRNYTLYFHSGTHSDFFTSSHPAHTDRHKDKRIRMS